MFIVSTPLGKGFTSMFLFAGDFDRLRLFSHLYPENGPLEVYKNNCYKDSSWSHVGPIYMCEVSCALLDWAIMHNSADVS